MAVRVKKNAYFCDDPHTRAGYNCKKLVVFGKRRKQRHELVSPDVFNVMRLDKKYNWIQIPQPHKQGRTYVPTSPGGLAATGGKTRRGIRPSTERACTSWAAAH